MRRKLLLTIAAIWVLAVALIGIRTYLNSHKVPAYLPKEQARRQRYDELVIKHQRCPTTTNPIDRESWHCDGPLPAFADFPYTAFDSHEFNGYEDSYDINGAVWQAVILSVITAVAVVIVLIWTRNPAAPGSSPSGGT